VRRVHEGGLMSMVPREIKLDRQAKTHLAIYNAFKDSKLSKELYYKKNISKKKGGKSIFKLTPLYDIENNFSFISDKSRYYYDF
jgi:hypothetical protein